MTPGYFLADRHVLVCSTACRSVLFCSDPSCFASRRKLAASTDWYRYHLLLTARTGPGCNHRLVTVRVGVRLDSRGAALQFVEELLNESQCCTPTVRAGSTDWYHHQLVLAVRTGPGCKHTLLEIVRSEEKIREHHTVREFYRNETKKHVFPQARLWRGEPALVMDLLGKPWTVSLS